MNDTKPDNPDAFPIVKLGDESYVVETGMTLRDYFAAKALQVVMEKSWKRYLSPWQRFKMIWERGDSACINHYHFIDPKYASKTAYEFADAMLKERMKP
jgi:hypothetical protein